MPASTDALSDPPGTERRRPFGPRTGRIVAAVVVAIALTGVGAFVLLSTQGAPPLAVFTVTPDAGDSLTVFVLDATASVDPDDPAEILEIRSSAFTLGQIRDMGC
jgi:hypothetical protein